MKVIINDENNIGIDWRGRQGEIVAVVKTSKISGHKRKYWTEYIVQFESPKEWSFFRKEDFIRLKVK